MPVTVPNLGGAAINEVPRLATLPPQLDLARAETFPYQVDLTNYVASGDVIFIEEIALYNLNTNQPVNPSIPWYGGYTLSGNNLTITLFPSVLQLGQTYEMAVTASYNTNKILTFTTTINIVA